MVTATSEYDSDTFSTCEEMQRHLSFFLQSDYGHKSRLSESTSACAEVEWKFGEWLF